MADRLTRSWAQSGDLIFQVFEQDRPEGLHHHAHVLTDRGVVVWNCKTEHFHADYADAVECATNGLDAMHKGKQ